MTPLVDNRLHEDQTSNTPEPLPPSPPRKQVHEDDSDSDGINDNDNSNKSTNEIVHDFGKVHNFDCVIDRDDFLEPKLDEILNFDLNREARTPIKEHLEKNLDLLAFPHLFPHGVNGLHAFRKIPITPLDYFQQRLMSSSKRFAGNTDFLFYALSVIDSYRAKQKVSVCCAMKRQGGNVNNSDVFEELGIRAPHVYMSSIRGSSSYWRQYTGDVLAMIKQLGIPSFFFTFSFDDLNSDDCVNSLWKAKYGANVPNVKPGDIPYDERKALLNDFPIVAAKHFSMRLTKLLAFLKNQSVAIFGKKLIDYTIRIEFQARGSPHCHSLLWFEEAPDWNFPEGIKFLEENVSCSLNSANKDLVLKYQRHRHAKSCFKRQNRICRFTYPKPARTETLIFEDGDVQPQRGKFVELKRTEDEAMIKYYHPALLNVLQCNMDIQRVCGANAVAYYIGKYMSKAEPTEIRPEIEETIKKIQDSSLPSRQKMFKVAMTIMREREIGAQEAAFRLGHLYLRKSSRSTVFIPTYKKRTG